MIGGRGDRLELNFCSGEDYFGPFMFFVRIFGG